MVMLCSFLNIKPTFFYILLFTVSHFNKSIFVFYVTLIIYLFSKQIITNYNLYIVKTLKVKTTIFCVYLNFIWTFLYKNNFPERICSPFPHCKKAYSVNNPGAIGLPFPESFSSRARGNVWNWKKFRFEKFKLFQ